MKLFKQVIAFAITFQFCMPHVYAQNTNSGDNNNSSEIPKELAEGFKDEADRQKFAEVQAVAESLESGKIPEVALKTPADIFHIGNQRVEIVEHGEVVKTIDVNEVRAKYEAVAASDIRPVYNAETRELIFEGVNGMRADGTGGNVVARHILPGLDIAAMRVSNEFLVYTNSRGEVGLVDMGYVAKQVFKNPLFAVDNVWKPDVPVENLSQLDVRFLTPGSNPLSPEAYEGFIYSRNDKGSPVWQNGDVRITYRKANGAETVLALLPRLHFYMKAQLAAGFILKKLELIQPTTNVDHFIANVMEYAERSPLKVEQIPGSYDDALKRFVSNIEPDQIDDLKARLGQLDGYSQRRFGKQDYNEAVEQFEEIRANFAKTQNPLDGLDEMERKWYEHLTPVSAESPFKTDFVDVLSKVAQKTTSLKSLGIIFGVATGAYLGFPYAYENIEALQHIQLLSWFYQHALPDVLNHPFIQWETVVDGQKVTEVINYRKFLILNMVALVLLWPAAHVSAYGFKKLLTATYNKVQHTNTKFAVYVRDMYRNWAHLSNWQVVTSFGMRIYSLFIYPAVRFSVEQIFRQKSFFVALANNQNPLRTINKDSELGRSLGLEKSTTLGLNNPFANKRSLQEQTDLKMKAQALLREQNMKRSQMAFLLATLSVSEQSGIDPATLLQLGEGSLKLSDLSKVFSDKRKKREWFLTAKKVYDMLEADKMEIRSAIQELPVEEFKEVYEKAKKIAAAVHAQPNGRQATEVAWTKFKRAPFWLANNMPFVSGGVKDFKFLNTVYTNKFVSDQVHKQFYIDHLMVVGIVSLMPGPEGRANLSMPHNLAADPRGILWSSGPHLNDTVTNTYIHFFVSGAKTAMVYQSIKAQADELPTVSDRTKPGGPKIYDPASPNNYVYDPLEDFKYLTTEREQGFTKSTYDWLKSVLTFTESDLGGIMWKGLQRRLTTLQGGFLTFLIFQMAFIHDRALSDALLAYVLMFSAAYWRYAWPWDPVQVGNSLVEGRFAEKMARLNLAKENLLDAMKERDPALAQTKIQKAYADLLVQYKENPRVVKKLIRTARQSLPEYGNAIAKDLSSLRRSNASEQFQQSESSTMFTAGLLAKLSLAIKKGDREGEERYRNALIQLMDGNNNLDLKRLSSQGLFELALSNSPVYTKPSSVLSAFTTLGAAIGTTVLAISLMTQTTTSGSDKPTLEYILEWTALNFALFGASYFAFGAKPWRLYLAKWEQLKERFKRGPEIKAGTEEVQRNRSPAGHISPTFNACQKYFM